MEEHCFLVIGDNNNKYPVVEEASVPEYGWNNIFKCEN